MDEPKQAGSTPHVTDVAESTDFVPPTSAQGKSVPVEDQGSTSSTDDDFDTQIVPPPGMREFLRSQQNGLFSK